MMQIFALFLVLVTITQSADITDPRTCLTTPENMVAWYDSYSIDISKNIWIDKTGGEDGDILFATGLQVFSHHILKDVGGAATILNEFEGDCDYHTDCICELKCFHREVDRPNPQG
eukprot:491668_1